MIIKEKAELSNLPTFMDFIRQYALDLQFKQAVIQKIELALEEALVNIINYAYSSGCGDIEIECREEDDRLKIMIADWGIPFDILTKEDPDTSLAIEDRKIGGLGIFLVKQMMDDVTYTRQDDKNILTLIKYNE